MGIYKGYTEGQNKATQKYQKENLEQVRVWVRKGEREKYKAYAESKGLSLNRKQIMYRNQRLNHFLLPLFCLFFVIHSMLFLAFPLRFP